MTFRIVVVLVLMSFWVSSYADGARQRAEIVVPEKWKSAYEGWGYAPAVKIDNIVYVSGVVVSLKGEGSYEERYVEGFKHALKEIEGVLKEAGATMDDIVKFTTYHTDLQRQLSVAVKVRMESMNPPHPAWTAVGTTALATPFGVTEIDVTAHVSE
ncbi:MAG: Rid family hydrolase [Pseudomonadota bacterium]